MSTETDVLMDRLRALQQDVGVWSDAAFGVRASGAGAATHLGREAKEVQAEPFDIVEWADCLLLTIDGARQSGFSVDALLDAAEAKFAINRQRQWGKVNQDGIIEHVRE